MEHEKRQAIKEIIEETIKDRDCPKCHIYQPMVRVERVLNLDTDDETYETCFRCLGCLTLWERELKEVQYYLNSL